MQNCLIGSHTRRLILGIIAEDIEEKDLVGGQYAHNLREGAPNRHSPLGTSEVFSPHPERRMPIRERTMSEAPGPNLPKGRCWGTPK